MDYQPIANYAVVGNMRSTALVGLTGSIDFFCFPRFDSPTVFAALLDPAEGGHFSIRPNMTSQTATQLYLPDTNILLTRFLAEEGMAEVMDLMPILDDSTPHQLIRKVTAIRGEVEFTIECRPRFDYARMHHTTHVTGDTAIFQPAESSAPTLILQATMALHSQGHDVTGTFRLKPGETAWFTIGELDRSAIPAFDTNALEARCSRTFTFWQAWVAKGNYKGRWRDAVVRSALLLKLLTDKDYGSIVAAPTFGLPEKIGGARNWDYRYTWLRDSSFTLYALIRLGFTEEAMHFQHWLKNLLKSDSKNGPLQVLYSLEGNQEVPETELTHLRGYRDSRPVRIGNAAYTQLQLDIYGEMMDAVYLSSKYGDGISIDHWDRLKKTAKWLSKNWQREDEGIWEVRGGRKSFLHSRLMCWVAFDRMIRLANKRSLPGPLDWMIETRDAITHDIHEHFWSEKLQAFVQYKGSETLDAAVLLMPMMRFISPTDPRWLSTMAAIEKNLVVDVFVSRYRAGGDLDGLAGDEGSFNACSFWFIEALARSHQLEKARLLFEKMLSHANHVGLYSEELGRSGEHLGNFPQALSHLALISAATFLDRALSGDEPGTWQ